MKKLLCILFATVLQVAGQRPILEVDVVATDANDGFLGLSEVATADLATNTVARVKGGTTPGDGGGGDYLWNGSAWGKVTSDDYPTTAAQSLSDSVKVQARANLGLTENYARVTDYGAIAGDDIDDTAAFQAAVNTGDVVYIPAGKWTIDSTITLNNKGQRIVGESVGNTLLDATGLSAGEDLFYIDEDQLLALRMPSTSTGANNFGLISGLSMQGPGLASTSTAIANETATGGNTIWQAEGWEYQNLYIIDFEMGLHMRATAKVVCRNLLFKNCTKAMYFEGSGTATNNTHYFEQISFSSCTTGLHLSSGAAVMILADTTAVGTVVDLDGGNLEVMGGQVESSTEVINNNGGSLMVRNMRILNGTTTIPFHIHNRGTIMVQNIDHAAAGITVPLIELHENNCSAFGWPGFDVFGFSNFADVEYQVKLWNGSNVHLGPFPIRPGSSTGTKDSLSRGHIYYAVDESNDWGDDIRLDAKTGISTLDGNDPYTRVSLIRPNNLTTEMAGPTQDILGVENTVLITGTSTGARAAVLPRYALAGAQTNNGHYVRLIDKDGNAGTNNITVTVNGTDSGNGVVINGSAVIDSDFGTALFFSNGGDWFRVN